MSGFRNLTEWVDAYEAGQTWSVILRKGGTAGVNEVGRWIDWMYLGGSPAANYYASSPLVAAIVDSGLRPYLPSVSPAKQFIKTLEVVTLGVNSTTATGATSNWILLDYLLYYPFIDLTAVGEVQLMDNAVAIPRYMDGKGVQIMLVGQSATAAVSNGRLTITYINQDGIEHTTPVFYICSTSFAGELCIIHTSSGTAQPFVPLALGDTGVRSITSVSMELDGGGIAAVVLVRPLHKDFNADMAHRNTSTALAYGSFAQTEFALQKNPIQIMDGAHLGFIGRASEADTRYEYLLARIETIWN